MLSQQIRQNEDYLNALSGILARNLASMLELDRRATDIDDLLGSMCAALKPSTSSSAAEKKEAGKQSKNPNIVYLDREDSEKVENLNDDELLHKLHVGYRLYLNEKIAVAQACAALTSHAETLAQETYQALESSQDLTRHSLRSNNSR